MERESSKRETESLELELDALPDELLLEILARVPWVTSNFPAKAAAYLRAVSRRWNSIVSSGYYFPRFLSLGEENNCPWRNGEALLFCYMVWDPTKDTVPQFYMLPSHCDQPAALDFGYISDVGRRHFVMAASEDLLLLTNYPYSTGPLVVCNPFTKRWVTLPHPPPPRWSSFRDFMIVCHPQGNRYRVVSSQLPGVLEDVFVSETGEWKKVQLTTTDESVLHRILPFRGKLYWYCSSRSILSRHVVGYDPFEESFTFFPDPHLAEGTYYAGDHCLAVVHGSLRMVKYYEHEVKHYLIIWELDCKQERWSLIYKSVLPKCTRLWKLTLKGLHPNGHVVYFETFNNGYVFLDWSEDCNNFSEVKINDKRQFRDIFLLTRPWKPTSVCFGLRRPMNPRGCIAVQPGILAALQKKGEVGYWKKIELH